MSLVIMKSIITYVIRGGIPEKDEESNIFTSKQYLVSVEK
jgi:hypothetical protein